MDEKPNEIMQRIESQRSRLGSNIDELERRVKETADVKQQFDRHPMVAVGLAFGGGLLLSSMIGGSSKPRKYSSDWSSGSRRQDWNESSRNRDWSDSSSYSPSSRYASSSYSGSGSTSPYSGSGYSGESSYSSPASRYNESKQSGSESSGRSFAGGAMAAAGSSAAMNAISGWLQNSKMGEQKDQALRTLDHMGAAFLSMAAEKVKDFLDSALPGFKQHLQEQEGQHQGKPGTQGAQGGSYYSERARSGGDWSRGSQSAGGSGAGAGSNWTTDPAQQGSYTNQGGQQGGWAGNPSRQGSESQPGSQSKTWPGGQQQTDEQRSRTSKEQTGSVQQDASSSSYNKP